MKRMFFLVLPLLLAPPIAHADNCSPAKVSDLAVAGTGKTAAVLAFTDSGDDCLTGTASSYEIRRSGSAITESNYYSATVMVASGTPPAAAARPTATP